MLTGACGVKGPLYLPNVPKDATWPYKSNKPAPASAPSGATAGKPAEVAPASAPPTSAAPASPAPADGSGSSIRATTAPEPK